MKINLKKALNGFTNFNVLEKDFQFKMQNIISSYLVKKLTKGLGILSLLFLFVALTPETANATHFRYGSITWEPVQGQANTIKFTVRTAWRAGFFNNPSVGQTLNNTGIFYYGSIANNASSTSMSGAIVTAVNISEGWIQTEWIKTVTYSTPGDYTAYFRSCCRINELQNNNSNTPNPNTNNNVNYRVETKVNVGGGNRPPSTTLPTIINLQTNQNTADIQVPGVDPDGDNITFRFATAAEATYGTNSMNLYGPPAGLNISSSGLISFNTVGKAVGELYSISVVLEDDEVGALGTSKTMVDVLIRIVGQSLPPEFDYTITPANGSLIKVAPGDNVNFTVKATDPDITNLFGESDVSIQAAGAPGGGSFSPALPTIPADPTMTTFDWTPVSGTADLGTYVLSFFAEDGLGVQTITNVTIVVTLAPVFTQASGQAIPECLTSGNVLNRTIEASDLDPTDQVSIISLGVQNPPSIHAAGFPVQTSVSPNIVTSIPTALGNPTTTQLDWNVTSSDWGIYELVFTAEDSYGDQTELEHYYIVDEAPQFTSSPVTNAFENQVYSYMVTATDPDVVAGLGDAIYIDPTRSTIPSWLTLVDNGDGTAVLSGTPTIAEVGTHTVSIELHDKTTHYRHTHCTQEFQNFMITVNPCNVTLTASTSDEDCPGANDGSIDLTVAGATGTTTYAWSNGDNTEDISGLAPNTYTVIVTDNVGCVESASFTINAGSDTTPPNISCPANITVSNAIGSCGVNVNIPDPGITDNCSGVTFVTSPASGSFFSVGTTTVTSTATDASGNFALCSFTITVEDTENPVISCPASVSVSADNGSCEATGVVLGNPFTTDNCPGVAVSNDAPASYPVGITMVTWTVTDGSGNSSNCTQTVTVTDDELPTIVCMPDVTIYTDPGECAARFPYLDPVGIDNCPGAVTILLSGLGGGNTTTFPNPGVGFPAVGTHTNTWQVTDAAGNTATCSFNVTVIDNEDPVISCPPNITVSNDIGNCSAVVNYSTPVGTDNCGGTTSLTAGLGSGSAFPVGTTTETYTVTDAAGNSTSCSFTVTVNDIEAPTISCPANIIVSNASGSCGVNVNIPDPTVADNCPGDVTFVTSPASGSFFPVGTTMVTSTSTDAAGNSSAACSFTITVTDDEAPTASCQDITVSLGSDGTATITAAMVDNGSSDNCGIVSSMINIDNFSCNLGDYTVTLTVTDAAGNSSSCDAVVTVIGDDGDCDTVHDACDLCDGGDDTVDNNADGLPDCRYPPSFVDIIEDWKCGNNNKKVLVCHVPPGNPSNAHTICISKNDIAAHVPLHGGDYLGSCYNASCGNSNFSNLPSENSIVNSIEKEHSDLDIFPNPATDKLNIHLHGAALTNAQIIIYDNLGKVVLQRNVDQDETTLEVDLSGSKFHTGIYFVTMISGETTISKRVVISK